MALGTKPGEQACHPEEGEQARYIQGDGREEQHQHTEHHHYAGVDHGMPKWVLGHFAVAFLGGINSVLAKGFDAGKSHGVAWFDHAVQIVLAADVPDTFAADLDVLVIGNSAVADDAITGFLLLLPFCTQVFSQ